MLTDMFINNLKHNTALKQLYKINSETYTESRGKQKKKSMKINVI